MAMLRKAATLAVLAAVAVRLIQPSGDAWVFVEIVGLFVALPVLVVISVLEIVRSRKEAKG